MTCDNPEGSYSYLGEALGSVWILGYMADSMFVTQMPRSSSCNQREHKSARRIFLYPSD